MGWNTSKWIVDLTKGASKLNKASKFSTRISSWLSGVKWGNVFKVGAAGGIGYTIYHAWGSGVDTIANATGLDSGTVESILFLSFGIIAAYVAAKLLFPDNGSTTVVVGGSKVTRTYDKKSSKKSSAASRNSGRSKSKSKKTTKGGRA